jgi:hypothetical protein
VDCGSNDLILNRAHARTFNLQKRIQETKPEVKQDEENWLGRTPLACIGVRHCECHRDCGADHGEDRQQVADEERGIEFVWTQMTLTDFRQSLSATEPPAGLTQSLAGLWWDAKGDWTRAHESAQQDEGKDGSWVHAYLHRKEGDQGNAAYWYGRAGKPVCREPLDAEWLSIVRGLLG